MFFWFAPPAATVTVYLKSRGRKTSVCHCCHSLNSNNGSFNYAMNRSHWHGALQARVEEKRVDMGEWGHNSIPHRLVVGIVSNCFSSGFLSQDDDFPRKNCTGLLRKNGSWFIRLMHVPVGRAWRCTPFFCRADFFPWQFRRQHGVQLGYGRVHEYISRYMSAT